MVEACDGSCAFSALDADPNHLALLSMLLASLAEQPRPLICSGPLSQHLLPLSLWLAGSLLIRARMLSLEPVVPPISVILTLIAGAMSAAFWGATLAHRLSEQRLEQLICILLTGIGGLLIAEAFIPGDIPALLPSTPVWRIGAGVVFGLAIGLVSSLLGVAGGELIIPTLMSNIKCLAVWPEPGCRTLRQS